MTKILRYFATLLLLVLSFPSLCSSFHLEYAPNYLSYTVEHDGKSLFKGDSFAVFLNGDWCVAGGGATMKLDLIDENITGNDATLGMFEGILIKWSCRGVPIITVVKNFLSKDVVSFQVRFPQGANGTSTVDYGETTFDGLNIHFPAFFDRGELNEIQSWQGDFVQGRRRGASRGPTGGPMVFYGAPHNKLVVVMSSWGDHPKAYSSGSGQNFNGTQGYVSTGTSGRIQQLEPGYQQEVLLYLGTSGIITTTIQTWGQLYQQSRRTKGRKMQDVTVDKIGYQTDNGAYYCFCSDQNCSATLIHKLQELKSNQIPMGYLSFQGRGASSSDGDAPWCVTEWGVDGALGPGYPVPMPTFSRALDGVPLQLYAPYFCPSSPYFQETGWSFVTSDPSLPDCEDFDFRNVHPRDAFEFYTWFFQKGIDVGMTSFEPDFLNQNYNCVPYFITRAGAVEQWQHGMADAALMHNVTIQWCYATASDVMNAVNLPAVTNFRVSFDYCYGESWNIGESSLLVWALGARPSKDTLWTTLNNRTEAAGCPWTPDHEVPELHVILALLSTGPMGISDALGQTNATLLQRSIRKDGTLLQPSKPITAIDSTFYRDFPEDAHVYGTYALGPSWLFVSFRMQAEYTIKALDLWPSMSDTTPITLVHRRFDQEQKCAAGKDAILSGCVATTPIDHIDLTTEIVTVPKSSFDNVTAGSDLYPALTTVWRVCPDKNNNGWVLLGELDKYVSLSPLRFESVTCTLNGVTASVKGNPGEVVHLTALEPTLAVRFVVVERSVTIPRSGIVMVAFETKDQIHSAMEK